MGKEKSLEEIEAELAAMDAELAQLQGSAPPRKEKTSFLKRKKAEAPPEEPSPAEPAAAPEPAEPKPSLLSRFRRDKEEPAEAAPAEAAPEASGEEKPSRLAFLNKLKRSREDAPPEPAEPAPVLAPPPAPTPSPQPPAPQPSAPRVERIPPPTGTWVQEGKSWRRVAGGAPAVQVEGAPAPLPPPPGEEPAPAEGNRRRIALFVLIPLALLLIVGAVFAASTLLGGTSEPIDKVDNPPANVSTPKGDLKAAFLTSPARATQSYKINEQVTFDAKGSTIPAGETAKYEWDFGDGGKSTGATARHVYRAAGNYTATLKVEAAGAAASVSKVVRVVPAPAATLTATKAGGALGTVWSGDTVEFSGTGSTGAAPLTYTWSFGDGTNATGEKVTKAYTGSGSFRVTLTVTDGNGVPATKTRSVFVSLREGLSGSAPPSAQGATSVPFAFNSAPGGLLPQRITVNITYSATVGTGGQLGGLPVQPGVDELTLVLLDATGAVVAEATGSNGVARVELTEIDPATLGGWTVEVRRAQGPGTAAKPFTGLLEVELPANA